MSLLFQHGSGKNAYDPYMSHANGKELKIYLVYILEYREVVKFPLDGPLNPLP